MGLNMAGSSDPFRNVRFAEPEDGTGNPKPETGNRKRGILSRIFGRRSKPEEPEPITFPARSNEGLRFLESLPGGGMREAAFAAVRRRYGEGVPSLAEVKEALITDGGAGDSEMKMRRDLILALVFGSRKYEFDGRVVLDDEAVNALYFGIGDFNRINCVIRRREGEALRAKGEDREEALAEIVKMLGMVAARDRLEALGLVADVVEKMGEELCSKEVCERIGTVRANVEAERGRLAALREIAEFVREHGVKPSGKNMESCVPRAEIRKMNILLGSMPGEVAADAAVIMEKRKPRSCEEFMRILEEDEGNGAKRKQAVLKAVFPEGIISGLAPEILDEKVARNIAYFCIADIVRATSFADVIKGDGGKAKRDALEIILWIAKRMPEGARMEAPGIIAKAMENLVDEGKPKAWIVTGWLEELNTYMLIPDKNAARNKLAWVSADPMKVLVSQL